MSVLWHFMFWIMLPASMALCLTTYNNMRSNG